MAGFLAYGAGAHEGLDEILDREYRRQVEERLLAAQAEVARHNQAEEGIQGRTLDMNDLLRRDTLASQDAARQAEIKNKLADNYRAGAVLRPIGATVTPEERGREMEAGIPSGVYKQTSRYEGMSGDDASEPVGEDMFSWAAKPPNQSTGQTQTKPFHYQGKEIIAQETPEGRIIYQGKDITDDPNLRKSETPDRVLVPVQGPGGEVTYAPRGSASGAQTPLPATERQNVEGLDYLNSLVAETLKLGDESGWAGVGPVKGKVLGPIHDYTGIDLGGEGTAGQTLRAKIEQIRTESSFAQGGKNLTPTERAALDSFLATVGQDPQTAKLRLQEYMREQQKKREGMLRSGGGAPPPGGGGGGRIYYDADGNPIQR